MRKRGEHGEDYRQPASGRRLLPDGIEDEYRFQSVEDQGSRMRIAALRIALPGRPVHDGLDGILRIGALRAGLLEKGIQPFAHERDGAIVLGLGTDNAGEKKLEIVRRPPLFPGLITAIAYAGECATATLSTQNRFSSNGLSWERISTKSCAMATTSKGV